MAGDRDPGGKLTPEAESDCIESFHGSGNRRHGLLVKTRCHIES